MTSVFRLSINEIKKKKRLFLLFFGVFTLFFSISISMVSFSFEMKDELTKMIFQNNYVTLSITDVKKEHIDSFENVFFEYVDNSLTMKDKTTDAEVESVFFANYVDNKYYEIIEGKTFNETKIKEEGIYNIFVSEESFISLNETIIYVLNDDVEINARVAGIFKTGIKNDGIIFPLEISELYGTKEEYDISINFSEEEAVEVFNILSSQRYEFFDMYNFMEIFRFIGITKTILILFAIVFGIMALLVLINYLSIIIIQREKYIFMLYALGASRQKVLTIYSVLIFVVITMASIMSILLSILINDIIQKIIESSFNNVIINDVPFLIILLVGVMVMIISVLYCHLKLKKMNKNIIQIKEG